MKRILHIEFAPSDALTALSSLRAGATGLGAHFEGEVAAAWRDLEGALELPGRCIEWLWQRGFLRGAPATRNTPRWMAKLTLHIPLRALDPKLDGERDPLRGPAHTTLFALRALLRTLHAHPWFTVLALRIGKTPARLAATLRAVEADARARKLPDDAVPSRLTRARPTPDAHDTAAPAESETVRAAAKTAPPKRAKPVVEAPAEPPPKRNTKRAKPAADAGFGGLPDDAVSEDRTAAASLSARGLTLDAEFFLAEAKIEAWPCAAKVLERARKVLLLQLHPDRAGESSTTAFHRAIKGFEELRARLPQEPEPVATPPAPPPAPAPPVDAAPPPAAPRAKPRAARPQPPPARVTSRGEWPPPPTP